MKKMSVEVELVLLLFFFHFFDEVEYELRIEFRSL